jgi:ligand-binding sensor domain-containing protein/serine phosphatase RsbU (regulator of sigma subunit)
VNQIVKSFIVFISLFGIFLFSFAGERDINALPKFTIGDGLSNNSVTVIFQDSFGFLWIGTEDGLNRYDGYEFKAFRHNPADEHSISGNHIQTITQDHQNNLWIGTRNSGLSKLDYATGEFTTYLFNYESEQSLPETGVYGFLVDKDGRLWIKTQSFLSLFKGDSLGFESYGHFNNVFNVKEASRYPIVYESDTSILVGTKDGLNRFNTRTKHFSRLGCGTSEGLLCQEAIYDILPYNNNKYILSSNSGVQLFSFDESVSEHVFPMGTAIPVGSKVNVVLQLEDETILAGTNRGLEVLNSKVSEHHLYSVKGKSAISYNITALFEDRSGIIWVGTRYNGLLKLDMSPAKFHSLNEYLPESSDFKSFNFQTIYQDNDGNVWLGTIDSGIYKYDVSFKKLKHYIVDSDRFGTNTDAVYVLYADDSGRLWAGTNNGLYYYSRGVDHFVAFSNGMGYGVENLLKTNHIYSMQNDFDGNLWIGSRFGLYRYDGNAVYSFFHDKRDSTGLYSDHINALLTDEEGNLWIGTSEGLNVWDKRARQIRRLSFRSANHAITGISVLSLSLTYNGKILVGTRSGVWVVSDIEAQPVLLPGNENLDNDMIKAVISDNTNRVWVSTNKGIGCLLPDGVVYNFDIKDGLPGYIFNESSVFKNRSGSLFFGSTEGLCWFHPDSISYNLTKPPLAITGITVTYRGEKTDSFWPMRDKLEIKYRPFISVGFEFSALEFTQPAKNRYKVFLKGYDTNWQAVTYDNKVAFSNLLPGKYTLKVMASNNDFTWNNEPLEMDIIVTPPLWMSNYAFAFYFLAVIFVIHLFINYRVRHYRKANKELQEKTVNKHQIEAQREVLTRVNRSLTDSINYARRIQRAMIPSEISFGHLFPESFVYLRARDIVSGDFYWFHEKGDKIFVTAVDCTGHGVPGAFMSIIGIDMLKNIVEIQGQESPSEILKTMNGDLIRTLHREQAVSPDGNVNDGMDMSLLVINRGQQKLEYSGAYNGFYLVRDNEIISFKADRFPVGFLKDGESPVFTRKEVSLQEGDVVYLFSDGLPDQFGGPEHKKFKYRRFRLLLLNIHKMPFPDQKAILHEKIEEWMNGENEQVDDMLILGFKPLG